MDDVTIIVTTFERPDFILECVESIRHYYPNIEIIVSDNGKKRPELQERLEIGYGCQYIGLPFDSGASRARNEGFKKASTKYAVLCEDDFRFTEKTKLESFKGILDNDPSIGIIGGVCLKDGKAGIIGSRFLFDWKNEIFWRDPIKNPEWKEINGTKYYYCDYIRMFFMARNLPDLCFFDEDFKAGGNHTSGLIELKKEDRWKIGFTFNVEVIHDHSQLSDEYKRYRYRRRGDWQLFYKKTGLRYGIFDRKRVRDYKEKKSISFPVFLEMMREIDGH